MWLQGDEGRASSGGIFRPGFHTVTEVWTGSQKRKHVSPLSQLLNLSLCYFLWFLSKLACSLWNTRNICVQCWQTASFSTSLKAHKRYKRIAKMFLWVLQSLFDDYFCKSSPRLWISWHSRGPIMARRSLTNLTAPPQPCRTRRISQLKMLLQNGKHQYKSSFINVKNKWLCLLFHSPR